MLKFVNLHGHTNGSVYDALGHPKDYAEWMLKNAGESSGGLAITDHGSMSNIGYQAAAQKEYEKKGAPVKMIYGVEAYFLPDLAEWRALKDEEAEKKKEKKAKKDEENDLVIENEEESKNKKFLDPINRRNHLVVVAQNQIGLENLFRLVSRSYRQGLYRKPRIDLRMLRDCNEGLIVSTACIGGIAGYASFLAQDQNVDPMQMYENELGPLMEIFGPERFFLELQFNRIPEQQLVNQHVTQFAEKTGFKLIATADCHYPDPDLWRDRELYKLLGWQMQKNDTEDKMAELKAKARQDLDCELYLKNGDQMFQAYKNSEFAEMFSDEATIREAIERTYHIAHDMIEQVYPNDSIKLPKTFQVTESIKTPFDRLRSLCLAALKNKGLNDKKYVERTIYELKVIRDLGVSEYFLAQKEILDVLRRHMLTGVSRGSGGGSLVCYLLDITFIDPIKYDLLFERFMSMSRAEMPDVDCLKSDMRVLTPEGVKAIKDIKKDDCILDHHNNIKKVICVKQRTSSKKDTVYNLIVCVNDEVYGSIIANSKHRMLLKNESEICVNDITPGCQLHSLHGKLYVVGKEKVNELINLVDITVEGSSTFQVFPYNCCEFETNEGIFIVTVNSYSLDADVYYQVFKESYYEKNKCDSKIIRV